MSSNLGMVQNCTPKKMDGFRSLKKFLHLNIEGFRLAQTSYKQSHTPEHGCLNHVEYTSHIPRVKSQKCGENGPFMDEPIKGLVDWWFTTHLFVAGCLPGCAVTGPAPAPWAPTAIAALLMVTGCVKGLPWSRSYQPEWGYHGSWV